MNLALPSGTVAFLFTDIVGSTAHWERDRQVMASAVDRHFAILRASVNAHDGVPFKEIGDAIQASFDNASKAVAAALEAQRALLAEDWADHAPLRVRMAVHVGEATPRNGDYVAPELNRLSRLLNTGHGGQILLSEAAQTLVRATLPPGASLRDLGNHRLRDIVTVERIFQLIHPDIPANFPHLRTLDERPNNLPLQPTPFIGRKHELANVIALLQRDDARLVTLTGPGGVGKSRLALQAAADVLDDFPDGVFFVSLASLEASALVPSAIAQALGLREEGTESPADRLRNYLIDKNLFLVLDNYEHVLEGAQLVDELLSNCPELKVLITSRKPLRFNWERELEVRPMASDEAVLLFEDRAQAKRADFILTDEDRPVVTELCARVDSMPLAVTLAAGRVRTLSPRAILDRVSGRLDLLTGGPVNADLRQQTMRSTIAWSYDLLSPHEQALFRRLGAFPGGCTLDAANLVARAGTPIPVDVEAGLDALVESSVMDVTTGIGTEPRFVMLETLREYAVEKLLETEEIVPTWEALARFVLELAERDAVRWGGPQTQQALDEIEAEYPNIRVVLAGLLGEGDELGIVLANALTPFWRFRGNLAEGRIWLDRALAASTSTRPTLYVDLLLSTGSLAESQGDYPVALDRIEAALVHNQATSWGITK